MEKKLTYDELEEAADVIHEWRGDAEKDGLEKAVDAFTIALAFIEAEMAKRLREERFRMALKDAETESTENLEAASDVYDQLFKGR